MRSESRPRLEALSALRFFAALYVFLVHAYAMHLLERARAPRWFIQFSSMGYAAVTFFFILSGFVLVYSYAGREIHLLPFLRARLARLYPAYLVGLCLAAPFYFFAINFLAAPEFAWFGKHQALGIFLHVTMLQAWVPQAAIAWNGPGWAVGAFMFFYSVFPLLLKRMARLSVHAAFLMAGLAWLCSVGLAVIYVIFKPDHVNEVNAFQNLLPWLNVLKFNPLVRLPEFLLGMAVGFAVVKRAPDVRHSWWFIGGGLCWLAAFYAVGTYVPYPVLHTGLSAPAVVLIIYGLAARPRGTSFLASKPLRLLGDASLSFYLLHANFLGMFGFSSGPNTPFGWGKLVLALVVTSASAVAMYLWFEVPARKRFDRPRGADMKTQAAAVGA
jgi:peptidoglycan/LPS O-acetylase OafA/YrhL